MRAAFVALSQKVFGSSSELSPLGNPYIISGFDIGLIASFVTLAYFTDFA
jgi:hypothetical protein